MKEYFGFRKMVSSAIIKFIYILGALILTFGGIIWIFRGGSENVLIGLAALTLGNLFWRILCEGWILLFSMHDILGSVEKSLAQK